MAVTVEERKAAALESLVELAEHQAYADRADVMAARHDADCLGCMEVRAEAAEAKRKADEAKAAEADRLVAERDAKDEADRLRAQEEDALAAKEAARKAAVEKAKTDAQRGAEASAQLQKIAAVKGDN